MNKLTTTDNPLYNQIRELIDEARQRVATTVNAELTLLYWQIGKCIQSEVLKGERAEYGKQIIASLSKKLTLAYGKGWSQRQLHYCLRIAETFPDEKILHTLCSQLSWSHLRLLIIIDDPIKRNFYIEIAQLENWSVRQLQERIKSMLFERTAISKKPEKTIIGSYALFDISFCFFLFLILFFCRLRKKKLFHHRL